MTSTEKLVEKFKTNMMALGVGNYLIAYSDPDSGTDEFKMFGSAMWRIGVCSAIEDATKEGLRS